MRARSRPPVAQPAGKVALVASAEGLRRASRGNVSAHWARRRRIETAQGSSFEGKEGVSRKRRPMEKGNSGCGFPWETRRRPLRNSSASGPKGVGRHMCLVLVYHYWIHVYRQGWRGKVPLGITPASPRVPRRDRESRPRRRCRSLRSGTMRVRPPAVVTTGSDDGRSNPAYPPSNKQRFWTSKTRQPQCLRILGARTLLQ